MKYEFKATVEYKLFGQDDFDTFSDTYYIDMSRFWGNDDVYDYIADDMLLVVGGGYSTKSIETAIVTINGEKVKTIGKTKECVRGTV